MTSILGRIFGPRKKATIDTVAVSTAAYARAMDESDDLLKKMRAAYASTDPVRQAMADLWAQHNNVPFVTTVFEAVQEIKSGTEQRPEDK